MKDVHFNVLLSPERRRKINTFTAKNGMKNKELMENIADNLEKLPRVWIVNGKEK